MCNLERTRAASIADDVALVAMHGGLIGLGCARSRRKISPYVTQTAIQLLGTAHHAVAVGGQGSGASSPDGCLTRLLCLTSFVTR